jgi:hypothetical protein
MRRMCVVAVLLAGALMLVGVTSASALKLCIPKGAGAALVTPRRGKCAKSYKLTSLGVEGRQGPEGKAGPGGTAGPEGKVGPEGKDAAAGLSNTDLETLQSLLAHLSFRAAGVAGKPTVEFTGVNVQLVNGAGKTESANGEGNLVIGYDESPGVQTGSHDVMLGSGQTFSSFGAIVAGVDNAVTGSYSSVTGGAENRVQGESSSISGGIRNTVLAGAGVGAIAGGRFNVVNGLASTITGGEENEALGSFDAVGGGTENLADGEWAWVGGGAGNIASGKLSAAFGGHQEHASKEFEALP